jgi:hypothetical protein
VAQETGQLRAVHRHRGTTVDQLQRGRLAHPDRDEVGHRVSHHALGQRADPDHLSGRLHPLLRGVSGFGGWRPRRLRPASGHQDQHHQGAQ